MLPGIFNFEFYRGDRHEIFVRARDQVWDVDLQKFVPGDYIDLTNLTVASQLRVSKDAPAAAATFDVVKYDQVITKGAMMLVLAPSVSAGLVEGTYYWDLQISSDPQHVNTLLAGTAICIGDVTRV